MERFDLHKMKRFDLHKMNRFDLGKFLKSNYLLCSAFSLTIGSTFSFPFCLGHPRQDQEKIYLISSDSKSVSWQLLLAP